MNPGRIFVFTLVFVYFLHAKHLQSQPAEGIPLTYTAPVPGARYVMPGTTIAFRQGRPFHPQSLRTGLVEVIEAGTRQCSGTLFLTKDQKTLIFKPDRPFAKGATVQVYLQHGLKLQTGQKIKPVSFEFTITERMIPVDQAFVDRYILEKQHYWKKKPSLISVNRSRSPDTTLPAGLAVPDVLTHNHPPPGCYFYTPHDPWNLFPDTEPFIAITDAYGTLLYFKKLQSAGYDLKIQPNGRLSYYTYNPDWGHVVMDSAFRVVDLFQMGNGYSYTDFHDFQLLENGHGFVMTYDPQLIDMSQIVPGGNPEAIVLGFIMQELDADKNVIFEWRSWDHFEITDTGPEIDLTAQNIDYVHGNTIEVESDTSILLSSRNMHEVTKIHRNTGEIIWRLGGSQNQFTFLGEDTLRFNRQHDSRRQPDGRITLFDNGTKRPEPQFSSVPEFVLDLEDMTATLTKRYRHDPDLLGEVMGNAYYTPDTTIVIGWGSCEPGITEIDPEGNVLLEMQFDAYSYRAFRFPWRTRYFTFGSDSLCLEYHENSSEITAPLTVLNPQDHPVNITGYSLREDHFDLVESFPQTVPANDSLDLTVRYYPEKNGYEEDVLTLNSDISSDTLVQRIAQQVKLVAKLISGQSVASSHSLDVRIFPNPVRDILVIDLRENTSETTAEIFGISGVKLDGWKLSEGLNPVRVDHLPAGVYTLRLKDMDGRRKVIKIIRK